MGFKLESRPRLGRSLMLWVALTTLASVKPVLAQSAQAKPHCTTVGGTIMTNLNIISDVTTLGTATGDLKGAVSATILEVTPRPDGALSFNVQHHWVADNGDTILFAPVEVLAVPIAPGTFGATTPELQKIVGGTGRFEGASGGFRVIGAVRLFADGGETVFRYRGEVCFAAPGRP